jgi:hypothetical protein
VFPDTPRKIVGYPDLQDDPAAISYEIEKQFSLGFLRLGMKEPWRGGAQMSSRVKRGISPTQKTARHLAKLC